ncbi:MAG: glycosyltransferase family 4 protein [Candidatus Cloacimonetes bacterium]|nr:glycosyltransferase family 4 protein [Candidatus Cloacimonadota bacterium]
MSKIKLLHIQVLPILSGVQNVSLSILESLPPEKYEIHLICAPLPSGHSDSLIDRVLELGGTVHVLPMFKRNIGFHDFAAFWQIYRIIRKNRFDIVHTHSSKPGFLGRIAARLAGVKKVIHTVHGFPFHVGQFWLVQRIYMLLEKLAGKAAHITTFVSEQGMTYAIKTGIISKAKARLIVNGVKSAPEPVAVATDQSKFVIGSVARFDSPKNNEITIQCAIEACNICSRLAFVFIGDGLVWEKCGKKVTESGLSERIMLTGWQDNIQTWLRKMDVFLLYSLWEGLPLSILEAMAEGLPVVASDIRGSNELVSDETGWLVSVDKPEKLTQLLASLPECLTDVQLKGLAAYKSVKEKYRREQAVAEYQNLYEQ